jgi:NitT/TauT family transport system substrate-binding protein
MKRILALFLSLILCLGLCACGSTNNDTAATADDAQTEEAVTEEAAATEAPDPAAEADEAEAAVDSELPITIMTLNGTTGFGMAKLMADAQDGTAALNCTFSVESDASNITAALISGDCDIAALPTNAAATVYNKTEGGVQIAAINTLGVLYLVVNGEALTVTSLADLEGMTVYVPAQNPTYLFQALVNAAGVNVTIDNTYAQPADLRTALAAGEVDIAVLPEPMVTIACSANESLTVALDLTSEWDAVEPAGSLVQGCVVVRTEFAQEHPAEVAAFLEEYEASIAYLTENVEDAAQLIEQTGIFTSAAVAQKAIPNCNVCFLAGQDMKAAMSQFVDILFQLEPASVGGAVPGDDFYFIAE